jgi:hypothetical protein
MRALTAPESRPVDSAVRRSNDASGSRPGGHGANRFRMAKYANDQNKQPSLGHDSSALNLARSPLAEAARRYLGGKSIAISLRVAAAPPILRGVVTQAGPVFTLAALACAVAGQVVLFTADELAVCSHGTGTETAENTAAGNFVLFVGSLGATGLAVAAIVAVVRARVRRTTDRPSRLWILLAVLVFLTAGLAFIVWIASAAFACGVGFF